MGKRSRTRITDRKTVTPAPKKEPWYLSVCVVTLTLGLIGVVYTGYARRVGLQHGRSEDWLSCAGAFAYLLFVAYETPTAYRRWRERSNATERRQFALLAGQFCLACTGAVALLEVATNATHHFLRFLPAAVVGFLGCGLLVWQAVRLCRRLGEFEYEVILREWQASLPPPPKRGRPKRSS